MEIICKQNDRNEVKTKIYVRYDIFVKKTASLIKKLYQNIAVNKIHNVKDLGSFEIRPSAV